MANDDYIGVHGTMGNWHPPVTPAPAPVAPAPTPAPVAPVKDPAPVAAEVPAKDAPKSDAKVADGK